MATAKFSFEGGSNGANVAAGAGAGTGDTNFDTITRGTNATLAYDNTHPGRGSLGLKVATGASSVTSFVAWTTTIGTQTTTFIRALCFFTANPAANIRVINFVGAAASRGNILLNTNGKLLFTNAAGGTVLTATPAIPLNSQFRLEAKFVSSATVGQWEYKVWYDPRSVGTPDDTQTSAATQNMGGTTDSYRFGIGVAITSGGPYWLDDVAVSTVDYIGPEDPRVTGTATVSAKKCSMAVQGPVTTGAVSLKKMKLSGVASVSLRLSGAISLKKMKLSGTVLERTTATGAIKLKKMKIAGSDSILIVVVADMQPASGANVPPQVVAAQIRGLSPRPDYVLMPGDQANDGTASQYTIFDSYYGVLADVTYPVPGNHDHAAGGSPLNTATNLVDYDAEFGTQGGDGTTPPHFISFDTPNGWHIIGFDSGEQWVGSLNNPSDTYTAVADDLAANAGKPLIAFWHHPRWSDGTNTSDPGGTGDSAVTEDIWNLLYDYNCDLVFNGHVHGYQRFPKLGKTGSPDSSGIAEFVVASGGSGLFTLTGLGRSVINSYQSAAYDQLHSKWFGYLKLRLKSDRYYWEFISQDAPTSEDPGAVLDSGGPVAINPTGEMATGAVTLKKMKLSGIVLMAQTIGEIRLKKIKLSGTVLERTTAAGVIHLKKMHFHVDAVRPVASQLMVFTAV